MLHDTHTVPPPLRWSPAATPAARILAWSAPKPDPAPDLWLPSAGGLARALRRERARAGVRGSGYDPVRHLALLRAWRDARRGPV